MEIHDKRTAGNLVSIDSLPADEQLVVQQLLGEVRRVRQCSACKTYYSWGQVAGTKRCNQLQDHCDWRTDTLDPLVFKSAHWYAMMHMAPELPIWKANNQCDGDELVVNRISSK